HRRGKNGCHDQAAGYSWNLRCDKMRKDRVWRQRKGGCIGCQMIEQVKSGSDEKEDSRYRCIEQCSEPNALSGFSIGGSRQITLDVALVDAKVSQMRDDAKEKDFPKAGLTECQVVVAEAQFALVVRS